MIQHEDGAELVPHQQELNGLLASGGTASAPSLPSPPPRLLLPCLPGQNPFLGLGGRPPHCRLPSAGSALQGKGLLGKGRGCPPKQRDGGGSGCFLLLVLPSQPAQR